jgi:predicted PolB exonuclease-like 3'-5' exonuclease
LSFQIKISALIMIPYSNIICFDLETAPAYPSLSEAPQKVQELWTRKHEQCFAEDYASPEESYTDRSALFADRGFGQIVCAVTGFMDEKNAKYHTKKIVGSEADIVRELVSIVKRLMQGKKDDPTGVWLLGHNMKGFDLPYLSRRSFILNMPRLPQTPKQDDKPWTVKVLDTQDMWAFGNIRDSFVTLDQLCYNLGIESPKTNMDGSQVGQAYWDGRIEEIAAYCEQDVIAAYCEQDVIATMKCYQRLSGMQVWEQ